MQCSEWSSCFLIPFIADKTCCCWESIPIALTCCLTVHSGLLFPAFDIGLLRVLELLAASIAILQLDSGFPHVPL